MRLMIWGLCGFSFKNENIPMTSSHQCTGVRGRHGRLWGQLCGGDSAGLYPEEAASAATGSGKRCGRRHGHLHRRWAQRRQRRGRAAAALTAGRSVHLRCDSCFFQGLPNVLASTSCFGRLRALDRHLKTSPFGNTKTSEFRELGPNIPSFDDIGQQTLNFSCQYETPRLRDSGFTNQC